MKRLLVMMIALVVFAGCGEKTVIPMKKKGVFKNEVANLKATIEVGKVTLSWELSDKTDVDSLEIWIKYRREGRADGFARFKKNIKPDVKSIDLKIDALSLVTLKVRLIAKDGQKSKGKWVKVEVPHANVVRDIYEKRKMFVYLPDGYATSGKTYPVIYMHDGQNLFADTTGSPQEWRVDEVLGKLVAEKKVPEMVVVGICNGGATRGQEYIPYDIAAYRGITNYYGDEYSKYIVEKIIPYIEGKYRVSKKREDRAVMGSSLGGLLSFWMLQAYPDTFSFAGIFSPYAPWITNDLKAFKRKDVKMYWDAGTHEIGTGQFLYVPTIREYFKIMMDNGYKYGKDFIYHEANNAVHHETAWAKRLHNAILYFKGSDKWTTKKVWVELETPQFRQLRKGFDKIINPMLETQNGIIYSLMDNASYKIVGEGSKASVTKYGVFNFNGEDEATVLVTYKDFKKEVVVAKRRKKKKKK